MAKLLNSSSLCSAWIKTNRASGILWPPPAEREVWLNLPAMAMGVLTTTQYDSLISVFVLLYFSYPQLTRQSVYKPKSLISSSQSKYFAEISDLVTKQRSQLANYSFIHCFYISYESSLIKTIRRKYLTWYSGAEPGYKQSTTQSFFLITGRISFPGQI